MPEPNERSQGFTAIPRPERLAEVAYGRILDIIITRNLTVGDKLPSEAVLASTFAVSRPIIREALTRLRLDGLIEARQGSGSYLSQPPPSQLMARMRPSNISTGLAAYEVRLALEPSSARLAAENRTPQNLEQIERRLSKFEKRLNSGRNALEEDLLLHRAIAEATGNSVFVATFDFVTQGMHEVMTAILEMTQEDSPAQAGSDQRASGDRQGHRLARRIDRGHQNGAAPSWRTPPRDRWIRARDLTSHRRKAGSTPM